MDWIQILSVVVMSLVGFAFGYYNGKKTYKNRSERGAPETDKKNNSEVK